MIHQCDSQNPHSLNRQSMSHTMLLKSHGSSLKLSAVPFFKNMIFCALGCFHPKKVLRILFCLSLCFFSSIPPSSFLVSNWVSLIYSITMLAWPSLCWPCRKISGRLSNRQRSGYPDTTPALPVQAVNDCVSELELSQPAAPVALTAEP